MSSADRRAFRRLFSRAGINIFYMRYFAHARRPRRAMLFRCTAASQDIARGVDGASAYLVPPRVDALMGSRAGAPESIDCRFTATAARPYA